MVGQLLGGIATSLLFSVFDSWLIRAHSIAKIDKTLLSQSFSMAAYGNSIIAILAGLLANRAAIISDLTPISADSKMYYGGYIAPFDLAFLALCFCGVAALFLWEENYGETSASDDGGDENVASAPCGLSCCGTMQNAFVTTLRNRNILLCGIISSLFEGSMYVFVFMWTPALTSVSAEDETLPFGLIFSTFMVSCMAGSSLFSVVIRKYRAEQIAVGVFFMAAMCFLVITTTKNNTLAFVAMNVFELSVGMYFPSMGTMKSSIVPENQRAAIYNLYRIPLNFIVLTSLLTDLTPRVSFMYCCGMLLTATVLQCNLLRRRAKYDGDDSVGIDMSAEKEEDKKSLLGADEMMEKNVNKEVKDETV